MNYDELEPYPPAQLRPCSTPHSAPLGWLKADTPEPPKEEPPAPTELDEAIALVLANPEALAEVAARAAPDGTRRDGWTPFARRLFLEVLAETGRVSRACEYAQMTKQSAYALRARDSLFAASWDAACELARAPLADALYEKALDGVTETVTRDGAVVAERHRFDSRLSIAVLNRLDKRCDRAAETGSRHLALVRHWDQWMDLVGKGEEQAAQGLLDAPILESASPQSSPHGQFGQLPLGSNPTSRDPEAAQAEAEIDLSDRFWEHEELGWMTNLPPPPGFAGYQRGQWNESAYQRECTLEETELLDADAARAEADDRAGQDALRDAWFSMLREEQSDAADEDEAPHPHAGDAAPQLFERVD